MKAAQVDTESQKQLQGDLVSHEEPGFHPDQDGELLKSFE